MPASSQKDAKSLKQEASGGLEACSQRVGCLFWINMWTSAFLSNAAPACVCPHHAGLFSLPVSISDTSLLAFSLLHYFFFSHPSFPRLPPFLTCLGLLSLLLWLLYVLKTTEQDQPMAARYSSACHSPLRSPPPHSTVIYIRGPKTIKTGEQLWSFERWR